MNWLFKFDYIVVLGVLVVLLDLIILRSTYDVRLVFTFKNIKMNK